MTAHFLPAAASLLLAMASGPALAADLDDKSSDAQATLETAADAQAADVAAKGKSGGKSGGKSSGKSGGKSSGKNSGARSAPANAQARPAGAAQTAGTAPRSTQGVSQGSQRSSSVQRAPASTSSRAPSASTSRSSSSSTAARPTGSTANRPTGSTNASRASAAAPGAKVVRANTAGTSARPSTGSNAASANARHSSASAARHGSSQGSNAVRAGNNVKAANHHTKATHHGGSKAAKAAKHAPRNGHASHKARPGKHHVVVHHNRHLPPRWAPAYHRAHVRAPRYHYRYWGAGVFYYNPPPARRGVVVVDSGGQTMDAPTRAVDRNGDVSLGLRAGSYLSGYEYGEAFGDMGLGAAIRYRPTEALGLELAIEHHNETWDSTTSRNTTPISASVELFAFPWTKVNPYAFTGLTWTPRSVSETIWDGTSYTQYNAADTLFGPHGGLGIEFGLGDNASVNFEGKAIGYLNVPDNDLTVPGAVQGTMGLNFYF